MPGLSSQERTQTEEKNRYLDISQPLHLLTVLRLILF
jgi:hypothetical protein